MAPPKQLCNHRAHTTKVRWMPQQSDGAIEQLLWVSERTTILLSWWRDKKALSIQMAWSRQMMTQLKLFPLNLLSKTFLSKLSNWSAQSTAFGAMQAKACIPWSVSNTLKEKKLQKSLWHKCRSYPLWIFSQQRSGQIFKKVCSI